MSSWLRNISAYLDRHKSYGAVFIRLAFGVHLVRSSYPEVFDPSAQREFASYLASIGVPFPLVGSYLCHFAEFFGGLALILGLLVRPFGAVLVINFLVAIFVAQWGKPYKETFQAIQALAVALFSLVNGAGALSNDSFLRRKGSSEVGVEAAT